MNVYRHTESLLCNSFIKLEATRLAKDTPPSFLISEEAKETKIVHEIKKIYDDNVNLAVESLKLLVEKLHDLNCPDSVLKEIWNVQTKGEILDLNKIEAEQDKGSISDLLGLTKPSLEWMYKVVDQFLLSGKEHEAIKSLYFLNIVCPENGVYWLALGHSYFHLEQYDKALEAYQKSYYADSDDPRGLIWMAHTYEALGHPLTALEIVNELVDILDGEKGLGDLVGYQSKLQGAKR